MGETKSAASEVDQLARRIEGVLHEQGEAGLKVVDCRPMTGGACQENFQVDMERDGRRSRFCLRSDALTSLPGSVGRREEYAVIQRAVQAGVGTARASWYSPDLIRPGANAYFLDWLEGETIGARVTRHPKYDAARRNLPTQLAATLAAIHRITPATDPDLPISRACFQMDRDPGQAALEFLRDMIDTLPDGRPAMELGFRWLVDNCPAPHRTTLVHADFRTGNFMVDTEGLVGVLDWEFVHWGDPVEDIGWLCVRDWRFGCIDRPAGGLTTRDEFCRHYSDASGVSIDPERLHWWEVCGNLRWGAAAALQGQRYAAGGDFELLAIPRRAVEMEYEALRLIEVGP